MITNTKITIYHKELNTETKLNTWTKTIYDAWHLLRSKAVMNSGLEESNALVVRIPSNEPLSNVNIGDLVIIGEGSDIQSQNDLDGCYTIISITNNLYGHNKHIHIEAK